MKKNFIQSVPEKMPLTKLQLAFISQNQNTVSKLLLSGECLSRYLFVCKFWGENIATGDFCSNPKKLDENSDFSKFYAKQLYSKHDLLTLICIIKLFNFYAATTNTHHHIHTFAPRNIVCWDTSKAKFTKHYFTN